MSDTPKKPEIRWIGGADRPEMAAAFINAACESRKVTGIIVVLIEDYQDGNSDVDERIFGNVRLRDVNWAGSLLTHTAMRQVWGDPE